MISLYLDYLISYYISSYIPILSLVLIITLIYFSNNKFLIILPIIYDLLFSNTLFFYLTFYIIISYLIRRYKKKTSYKNYLFILINSIIIFNLYKYILLFLLNLNNIYFPNFIIIIIKSIILSFIISVIYYCLLKRIYLK